ncbi:helix-turn-helix domain-containing protein [Adhaeribacter terreus]|uniref:Helix-turn-helix domain-containing protein n=1 Tax=Adhaeribacter terreus TaxID=529703 RepID=A0ABW0EC44_9BACT
MQQANLSEVATSVYASKCDVMHMDISTPRSLIPKLSSNYLVSSCFTSFETEMRLAPGLGLKFVPEGKETYWMNGKKHEVTGEKYLLVNDSLPEVIGVVKGQTTHGMCVNIAPEMLNDLLLQVLCPNALDEINQVNRYLLSPELLVREAKASENLQHFLKQLHYFTSTHQIEAPPIEMLFEVASMLIRENLDMISSYYKLEATKLSTRQELFQRLLRGKEILDDSIFAEINIGQVAEECCLSEFRFYRLFKQCFGQSPYNYLFRRRIEKGLELKKQNLSWSEIAFQLNFTDLAAFSNGFKKITGVSPSKFAV